MLSEEEKKAIEFIKFYQQHCLKKEKENMKQYETVNDEEFVSKNLDTVLNLITKLQKENELAKEQLKKQCEIADERNNLLVKVNRLESQIDLMAEVMFKNNTAQLIIEYGIENKEQIIKEFEKLVKEKGE